MPDTSPSSRTGKFGLPMTSPKAAWRKTKWNKNNKFIFGFKLMRFGCGVDRFSAEDYLQTID